MRVSKPTCLLSLESGEDLIIEIPRGWPSTQTRSYDEFQFSGAFLIFSVNAEKEKVSSLVEFSFHFFRFATLP